MVVQPSFSATSFRLKARKEMAEAVSRNVPTEPSEATVAVIDNFEMFDQLGMTHGGKVAQVLTRGGLMSSEILQVQAESATQATLSVLTAEGAPSERLDAFLKGTALDFLESTQVQVEKLAQIGIKTVNHSQSLSAAKPATFLFNLALEYGQDGTERSLTDTGRFLCRALGLPESADWDNEVALQQLLLDRTQSIYNEDKDVVAARVGFDSKLSELKVSGLAYFVAAGNDAKVLKDLQRLGLKVADSLVHGLNSVHAAVVVGAFDDKGTADTSDDELASFSVQHPEVDFVAPGTGIDLGMGTLEAGTSFATPMVALRYEQARRREPSKSPEGLLGELAAGCDWPVQGSLVPVVRP